MAEQTAAGRDERTAAEVKRLGRAGLEGTELLRRIAEALQRSVPVDAYCAATVDPASNLLTSGIFGGWDDLAQAERAGATFFDRVYFEEDMDLMVAMLREGRTIARMSERNVRFRELLEPLGIDDELGVIFSDRELWGGMDMMRAAGSPAFAPREVALVRRIAPEVGAGLRFAALRAKVERVPAGDGVSGVITIDQAGRVVAVTPAVGALLADIGEPAVDWRERRDPPIAVRMVVTALERSLAPASERDRHLVPRLRLRGRSGRWLTLDAALTEPAADRPSERVVVIGPAQPHEVAWLNGAAYDLSPREEEVVELVVRGQSTKQIADRLFIAEHTVQRHLSNVFEKVGVRGRRALLKRLFFEQLLPSAG